MAPPKHAALPSTKLGLKPKHKAIAKKELSSEERVRRLFKALCAQVDGGHFKNAVKTCDKILRIDHSDQDAFRTKLFLLLQTEQYEVALALMDSLNESRQYEKTYALYRLHREKEALSALDDLKAKSPEDRGVMHLEAQLEYRQSSYQSALDRYTQLLDTSAVDSDEHADLLTNLNAAQAHLDFQTTGFLHALDALPASVINSLESTAPPPPPGASVVASASVIQASAAPVPSDAPEKKKVRVSRVPKGVIPGVTPPPDPERWLKKSERSNYSLGAGRRRKVGGGGATQGSVAEVPPSHASKTAGGKQKKKK